MSFRTDIQALRAIAVLLVVAFHVWPARLTGGYVGVDVFFVISGYLITGHLVREVASTGRVDLPTFYARRARRLLPAASLTLVAVGAAAYLWMPRWTWATVAADMAASTLYAENWMLLRRAVDYHAQDQAPSPLQHFWSLAVEEQFYLGWPLLVTGVAAWWRRRHTAITGVPWSAKAHCHHEPASVPGGPAARPSPPPRRAYALPMASLCAVSFACALFYARANPAAGYFMTLTRLHELGLGGLVGVWGVGRALKVPADGLSLGTDSRSHRAPGRPRLCRRTLAAAAGLLAIGSSGLFYSPHLPFPGAAALVPALGAVAVIVAGEGVAATHALTSALAHPWLQHVGDISYSLYLAHWPVVAMYPYMTGRPVDGFAADGATAVLVSFALAHGCKRLWEDRFRGRALDKRRDEHRAFLATLSRKEVTGQAQAGRPSRKLVDLVSRYLRSPLVGAAYMAALMAAATLSASLALHRQGRALVVDADTDLPAFDPTPLLLNLSGVPPQAAPLSRCTNFFGANASHPYPGAEVALHGCHTLNSVPIYEALSAMDEGTRHGCFHGKPYPNALGTIPRNPAISRGHVVVMGDSHAGDWVKTFEVVGKRLGFNVTNLGKSSCPPTTTLLNIASGAGVRPYLECQDWIAKGVESIVQARPLAVIFAAYHNYAPHDNTANDSAVAAGVVQIAKRIVAADIPVLYIKSTPVMPEAVPDCLAREVKRTPGSVDLAACSVSKEVGILSKKAPLEAAARMYPLMQPLSFDEALCKGGTCLPVIGNVVAYYDKHHLTQPFAQSLAPVLEEKLLGLASFSGHAHGR